MQRSLRPLPRRVQVTDLSGSDEIAKRTLEITRKPIGVLQKIGKFLLNLHERDASSRVTGQIDEMILRTLLFPIEHPNIRRARQPLAVSIQVPLEILPIGIQQQLLALRAGQIAKVDGFSM